MIYHTHHLSDKPLSKKKGWSAL